MASSVFFILLTFFGAFFVQKLVLAVIADSYADESRKALDAKKRRAIMRRMKNVRAAPTTPIVTVTQHSEDAEMPQSDQSTVTKPSFNPQVEYIPHPDATKPQPGIAANAPPSRLVPVEKMLLPPDHPKDMDVQSSVSDVSVLNRDILPYYNTPLIVEINSLRR